jgi:pyruvate kinase
VQSRTNRAAWPADDVTLAAHRPASRSSPPFLKRLTKIIATLGPASSAESAIEALIAAGTDVFRLNFSHGTHEEHGAAIGRIREAAARAGRHVAILQDLSGPKIRTGALVDRKAIDLGIGDRLEIATGDFVGGRVGDLCRVSTTFAGLAKSVRPGDRLLLDDGRIALRVESSDGTTATTTVIAGGPLGEKKGINLPGVVLPSSALTPKDIVDLRFGLARGVDIVALSFVQTAEDVRMARAIIAESGDGRTPIVAKIERPAAVENIDAILGAADAVMVARGDLGLEMPFERVPMAQKEITRRARKLGRPVIIATQVFDSMRTEFRPTRAEVSDAANAVDDAVDAIMMSGETAIGVDPTRTVQTLDAVIRAAESLSPSLTIEPGLEVTDVPHNRALCQAAVTAASCGHADAIVAITRGGKTAHMLSAFRPGVRVFAVTPDAAIARRFSLYRGVLPLVAEIDPTGVAIERQLLERNLLPAGAVVVFVSVNADLTRADANFLRISRI